MTATAPTKPKLLADDGEDAVGVGAGHVEELLAALAPAQARPGRRFPGR